MKFLFLVQKGVVETNHLNLSLDQKRPELDLWVMGQSASKGDGQYKMLAHTRVLRTPAY